MSISEKDMQKYWIKFLRILANTNGPLSANRKPPLKSWMPFSVGRTGVKLCSVIDRTNDRIRVEIYLWGKHANELFQMLRSERAAIEEELGLRLDCWEELKTNYRIAVHNEDIKLENRMDWPRQHDWLAEHLNKMHPVIKKYVMESGY